MPHLAVQLIDNAIPNYDFGLAIRIAAIKLACTAAHHYTLNLFSTGVPVCYDMIWPWFLNK